MKALLVTVLCMIAGLAQAVQVGDRLAPWTLLDQFDQPYSLDDDARVLLVARNMVGAKLVDGALQGKPAGYLDARHAIFLADISRMPKPIASLFAVPAMRKYDYRVLLDRQARVAVRYPVEADAVLWLDVRNGQIEALRSFTDVNALAGALEQAGE
ncbi:FAD/FMN-containing dehydrogenase [Aquipseudomonas campi]